MLLCLFLVGLASSVSLVPALAVPDWMSRPGTIRNAVSLEDESHVYLDAVVVDKISTTGETPYFVIREWFSPSDRLVVLAEIPDELRLGQTIDVEGTMTTLPGGNRAIDVSTIYAYADSHGSLLTHTAVIKGTLQPNDWQWKTDITVIPTETPVRNGPGRSTMDSNDPPPSPDPTPGATYYATIGEVLDADPPLDDCTMVGFECKPITSVGTDGTYGNYFVMSDDGTAPTPSIRVYYSPAQSGGDRVNKITAELRTQGSNRVLCLDIGPGHTPGHGSTGCASIAALGTIAWAKTFPDETTLPATLTGKVISANYPGLYYLYVQEDPEDNETFMGSGILVNNGYMYSGGQKLDITSAEITTIGNERAITITAKEDVGMATSLKPLSMTNRDVGGGSLNSYTPGVSDAGGANNVGLLVKVWGAASDLQSTYFYISDGSRDGDNPADVRVDLVLDQYNTNIFDGNIHPGDFVAVTGISRIETIDNQKVRVVKPRNQNDIQLLADIPRFTEITATPNAVGMDNTATITFLATESFQSIPEPTVTVNGRAAEFVSRAGAPYPRPEDFPYKFTYTYTIVEDDQPGWAAIGVSGRGAGTLTGTATSTDALRISDITFDECGNRLTSRDSRGVSRYEYDVLGRLTKVTDPNGRWVAYEYDLNGNKTQMTVHSDDPEFEHVTAYEYNDSGLLSQVTGPNSEIITYTYWDNGALKKMQYPNGIHADYAYNSRDWVTSLVHMKADETVVAGFSYTYDPNTWGNNGTPTGMVEDLAGPSGNIHGEVSYAYDDLYRLTGEVRASSYAYNKAYAYDGNGNRLAKVDNGTTYYHYNSADKLLDYGASNTPPYTGNMPLTYDDAGNLITEGGQGKTYTYTVDSLLASVTRQGVTNPSAMIWDRDDNRVSFASSAGGTWEYVYDPTAASPAVLEEITPTGPVSYIREPDGELIARIVGTGETQTHQYYHPDMLGSEKLLTNENAAATDAYTYDAWGNLLGHAGSTQQPYQYVGQLGYYTHYQDPDVLNETGQQSLQLGLRFYGPGAGRFTQTDPLGVEENWYAYVNSDPLSSVDPRGEQAGEMVRQVPPYLLPVAGGAAGAATALAPFVVPVLVCSVVLIGGYYVVKCAHEKYVCWAKDYDGHTDRPKKPEDQKKNMPYKKPPRKGSDKRGPHGPVNKNRGCP